MAQVSTRYVLKSAPLPSGLVDTDGVYLKTGSVVLSGSGATFRDAAGDDVVLTLPADNDGFNISGGLGGYNG